MTEEKKVTISIISGNGKTNVTDVNSSVWTNRIDLRTVSDYYRWIMDVVEITMPKELGVGFIEDMGVLLPYEDRKRVADFMAGTL